MRVGRALRGPVVASRRSACSLGSLGFGVARSPALALRPLSTRSKVTDGIPFRVFRRDVPRVFESWASSQLALLSTPEIVRVSSYFVPFWCFEADLATRVAGREFVEHENGPPMQVYAGHQFPRGMTEVLKNDPALARAFDSSMLDIDGVVDVDTMETYESTAFNLIKQQVLQDRTPRIAKSFPNEQFTLAFQNIVSRRVMMPAHVVEYSFQGAQFRVFVNGVTGDAFGVEQQSVLGHVKLLASTIAENLGHLQERFGAGQLVTFASFLVRVLGNLFARVLFTPPAAFLAIAASAAYAVYIRTYARRMEQKTFEEWEEMRLKEKHQQASMSDDWIWRPSGSSWSSSANSNSSKTSSKTSTSSSSSSSSSKTSSSAKSAGSSSGRRVPPPVNETDYYGILGLQAEGERATVDEIKRAFRRELMKYHPDHNTEGVYDPAALTHRTGLIIKAYNVLRNAEQRAEHDRARRKR